MLLLPLTADPKVNIKTIAGQVIYLLFIASCMPMALPLDIPYSD